MYLALFQQNCINGPRRQFGPSRAPQKAFLFFRFFYYEIVTLLKPLRGSTGTELSRRGPFFSVFAEKKAIHGHALRHGRPELYSYTARYNAV